ncbi:MAG: hypothetical protein PHH70_00715 [Candidatus Gracilibacteria bacterium]|nr:hypothetical protein [Candidatus Gracilibacteria bacterium]
MLSNSQIENTKHLLRDAGVQEDQLSFFIEQIISFVAIGYEQFIKKKI